ncbi:hypothetical protein ACVXG9_00735 [Escherichia coli]
MSNMTRAPPSALRQSSARKPLPAPLPREPRVIRPEEETPSCLWW